MKKNIAIIDNNEVIAYLSSCILKELGNNTYYCTDWIDLIEKVKRHPYFFNLIICNQTMNGLTETDIAEELYNINSNISLIILSGSPRKPNKLNRHSNIKAIILKPVSKEILHNSINNIFGE